MVVTSALSEEERVQVLSFLFHTEDTDDHEDCDLHNDDEEVNNHNDDDGGDLQVLSITMAKVAMAMVATEDNFGGHSWRSCG